MASKKSLKFKSVAPIKNLVQTRLSAELYMELERRADIERRSIANFLEVWLSKTFKEHSIGSGFLHDEPKANNG